jgi:hypothetical protein
MKMYDGRFISLQGAEGSLERLPDGAHKVKRFFSGVVPSFMEEGVGIATQHEHQEGISEEKDPVATDRKVMGSLERDTGLEPATFALARHRRTLPDRSFPFIANTLAALPFPGPILKNPDFPPQTILYSWQRKAPLRRPKPRTSDMRGWNWTALTLYFSNEIGTFACPPPRVTSPSKSRFRV